MFRLIVGILICFTLVRVLFYWDKGQKGQNVVEYVMPLYKTMKVQTELDSTIYNETNGRLGYEFASFEGVLPRVDSLMKVHDSLQTVLEAYPEAPLKPEVLALYRKAVVELGKTRGESLQKLAVLLREQITYKTKIEQNRVTKIMSVVEPSEQKFQQLMNELEVDYPIIGSTLKGLKLKEVRDIIKSM